jgi:ADP-heptose:LPS heptosyltransferase
MLPPLFLSVRAPTLLASFWRSLFGEKPGAGLPHRGPLSIIIFRLDALGDVVMTTPLFRELKRAFPKSHCTVVVQRALRTLLVTNPHINEILIPPQVSSAYLPRRVNELLAAWLLYWRHLRGRRFDVAISPRWDLDEHLATLLCLLTKATRRVGYTEKASPLKQRLNRGFDGAFSICLSAGPVRHEVVCNLMVLEALGGTAGNSRLEVWLTGRDRAVAARLLASVPAATRVIALGIGATTAGRCWPLQRYAECISRLARQIRVQPVIVCASAEREQGMQLEKLLNCESILLCGAPLREVCAVLERCDLFVGNDSGAAHLAAAMDCKTIVVSRHPRDGNPNHANSPLRFGPHCSEARVLQPASGLDACADGCRVAEPHCITAVSVDDVVAAARVMLGGTPASFHPEAARSATNLHACRELPLVAIRHLPDRAPFGGGLKGRG